MYTPRFIIFVETLSGDVIKAFTWTRDANSGIRRAQYEADKFGVDVSRVWAEPI